jgi:hypothetical protein
MVASVRNKSITHSRDVRGRYLTTWDELQVLIKSVVRPHTVEFAKIEAKLPVFSGNCVVMRADRGEDLPGKPLS